MVKNFSLNAIMKSPLYTLFIILVIVLVVIFVVLPLFRRTLYCQRLLPVCSGNTIMPFVKEGVFDTTGYIKYENGVTKQTKGSLTLRRDTNGKVLNYELNYNVLGEEGSNNVSRKGRYEMDDYGHIHRIITEHTKTDDLNSQIKHFQHGSATTIENNRVICEGSGSNHMLNRHHPCFITEIKKNNDGTNEFVVSINDDVIEYVSW